MLVGIVLLVLGLISNDTPHGRALLVVGLALGSLGGLDTAAREHFSGYRSHTLVLAAFPAVAAAVLSALAGVPNVLVPVLLVAVFMVAFVALRGAWERSAGD